MCKNKNGNAAKKLMIMKIKIGWNDFQLVIQPDKAAQAMELMEFINNAQVVEERYVGLSKESYVLEEKTSDTTVTIGTTNYRLVSRADAEALDVQRKQEEAERKAADEAAKEAKRLAEEAAALAQAQADEETMVNDSSGPIVPAPSCRW